MAANSLPDAFETCAAQVARGRSIEDAVGQYPQFADDLRLLLTVSGVVRRYELPAAELDAARARLQPGIDDLIDGFPDRRLPPWLLSLGIVVALALVVLALLFMLGRQSGGIFAPSAASTPTASPTAIITPSAMPSATATSTASLTPSPTAIVNACAQSIVLEGPIEAIRGNQVLIYGLSVVVIDPSLYSIGMFVRVVGCTCDDDCDAVAEASVTTPTQSPASGRSNTPPAQPGSSGAEAGSGMQAGGGQTDTDDDDGNDGDDG